VAIQPSVSTANPHALLLTPRTQLPPGQYQIVLSGQPGAALSANDGEPTTAEPPAANGDQIIARFTVAATP
jgi:hypothetical protein